MKNQKKFKLAFFEKINKFLFLSIIFFLPTQFGKYFFLNFSYLSGLRVDYLAIKFFLIDVLIFIFFIFNFKSVFKFLKQKKFFLLYFLLFINLLISKEKFLTLFFIVKIFQFLTFYFLTKVYFLKIDSKIILLLFLIISSIQFFLSFYQFYFSHSFGSIFYFLGERLISTSTPAIAKISLYNKEFLRPYGTFSHPNSLSGFFLLLYFFVLTNKKFDKFFLLKNLNLLIFNLLIFLSFSKISIVVFLFLNIVYFFKNKKSNCFICNFSKIFTPTILSLFFLLGKSDALSIDKRWYLIKSSFLIFKNYLFFGVGLNNYLIFQNSLPNKFPLFFNQPVHNIFLLILTEIGILGAINVLFFLLKNKPLLTTNYYLLSIILITGFFDHYWLTLNQNFLLIAFIYGSVSSSFFIFKLRSKS